jgi:hypothetical protein
MLVASLVGARPRPVEQACRRYDEQTGAEGTQPSESLLDRLDSREDLTNPGDTRASPVSRTAWHAFSSGRRSVCRTS